METKEKIKSKKTPRHIAIIMDGNGRWAKKHGAIRAFGHKAGIKSVRAVAEASAELGVEVVTLYTFSTENWNRPKEEVNAIMNLLAVTITKEIKTLNKNNIRLNVIGNMEELPQKCSSRLKEAIEKTKLNTNMVLNLALNYSGRWDITQATKKIAEKIESKELSSSEITQELVNDHLSTSQYPDPELLIRTSGELRISNFLLWQLAYSEIYITDKLWPDFNKEDLISAVHSYQNRERRFGKTGEQIQQEAISK